jgi:hypothetical protein
VPDYADAILMLRYYFSEKAEAVEYRRCCLANAQSDWAARASRSSSRQRAAVTLGIEIRRSAGIFGGVGIPVGIEPGRTTVIPVLSIC